MSVPDLDDVKTYLGASIAATDDEIEGALVAESAAQAAVCKIPTDPAEYPDDLAEALRRRVARNLAIRGLPLGLQTSMSEAAVATTRVGTDPEIKRLEAPHRRLVVG